MEEFPLDVLIRAINDPTYSQIPRATDTEVGRWLSAFMTSPQVWSRLSEIFNRPSLPVQVRLSQCYLFAAETLNTKLVFDFAEIASHDLSAFRLNLLSLLVCFREVSARQYPNVTVELAQCLGALAAQTRPIQVRSLLSEVMQHLSAYEDVLLVVLRALAKQSLNQSIVVDSLHSDAYCYQLAEVFPTVLAYLQDCNSNTKLVLEGLDAWIRIRKNPEDLVLLHTSSIFKLCFEAVKFPETSLVACQGIQILIEIVYEEFADAHFIKDSIAKSVLSLAPVVSQVVVSQDRELAQGLSILFGAYGEQNLGVILQQREWNDQTLEAIMGLFSVSGLACTREFVLFWESFAEIFNESFSESELPERQAFFSPLMRRVVSQCIQHFKLSERWMSRIERGEEMPQQNLKE
jgi:hypothetical protein